MATDRKCTMHGCRRPTVSRRLCRPHYDCREGNRRREERRNKLIAYGRYDSGLVDAGPAREHVAALSEFGLGYKRVAAIADLHVTTVRQLVWGRDDGPRKGELAKRIKRATAEAILAVEPRVEYLGARASLPAGPYVRRLKALVALGWSQAQLCNRLGVQRSNFRYISRYDQAGARRNRVMIGAATALRIVELYDVLSNRNPPENTHQERIAASRSRRYALEHGWPLPMDWESIDNDFDRPTAVRRSAA
jgi:transcriptional regulator with XRE-family HTH domain